MTLVQFLSEWIARSSILILSGAALAWLLRVKNPSVRLAASTALLAGSLAIPFLSAVLPKVPIEVSLASARPGASLLSVASSGTNYLLRIPRLDPNTAPAASLPASVRPFDRMRLAATLYALAVCLLLLRLALGFALSVRVFRRSGPTGLDVEGTQVRESNHVASPVTIGVFRPAMLLPLDWREWDAAKLNAVLAHERSHIRRLDPAVQFLSAVHRALLWANPLSWFLHRSIVRTAEEVSDGDAIAATADSASYAEILLEFMQRGVGQASWLGVPMAIYDRPERRIRRILNSAAVTRRLTRRSVVVIIVLGAPLAWLTAAAQTQSSRQPATVPATAQYTIPKDNRYEFVSIRPGAPGLGCGYHEQGLQTTFDNCALKSFIVFNPATGVVRASDMVGMPKWAETQTFTITAKAKAPFRNARDRWGMMLTVLEERFGLKYHHEKRPAAVYLVGAAAGGIRLPVSVPGSCIPIDPSVGPPPPSPTAPEPCGRALGRGLPPDGIRLTIKSAPIPELLGNLMRYFDRPLVDRTGSTQKYDVDISFLRNNLPTGDGAESTGFPTVEGALKKVGITVTRGTDQIDTFVIDRLNSPSEN